MSYRGLLLKTVFITLALASVLFISSCGGGGGSDGGGGTASNALTLTINSSLGSATSANPIPVTFIFNKEVADFTQYDISVTNGTLKNFIIVSTYDYRAEIVPVDDPTAIIVSVAEGAAATIDGERSPAAQCHISYGSLVLNIDSPLSDITPADTIPATFTFNYDVDDFDENDISVTNGRLYNFSGSGAEYTAEIEPEDDGLVEVTVEAGAATDVLGNECSSGSFSITYMAFSLVISSTQSSPTAADPIPVTFTFNYEVDDFEVDDVSVTNGTLSNLNGNGAEYTAEITPVTSGTVEIKVDAGAVTNIDGIECNPGSLSITFDPEALSVVIESSQSNPTTAPVIPVTFTFNRYVVDFDESGVLVTNGTLSNLSGNGMFYTADITPKAYGTVGIAVVGGTATDIYGIECSAAGFSIVYEALSLVISSSLSSPTTASTIPMTFTFNHDVTGFDENDVLVTNGTLSSFRGRGAVYTGYITPGAYGLVEVMVEEGAALDANNTECSSGSFSITCEQLSLVIDSSLSSPTVNSPIPVTFTFNSTVTGFESGDVSVTNGTLSSFSGSGAVYTGYITPGAYGAVEVMVAEEAATDIYGNKCGAGSFSIFYTPDSLSLVIESSISSSTTANTIPVTFTFERDVTDFIESDVSVTNGTLSSFSGSGAVYAAEIIPETYGAVEIIVGEGAAMDIYGTECSSASLSFISEPLYLDISSNNSGVTTSNPLPLTFTFNADVTGFDAGDVSVTNGTLESFSGSGSVYTAEIMPDEPGEVIVEVAAGAAHDAYDNESRSCIFTIEYERSYHSYLKAPNAERADSFGDSVAISGDTIAVGAQLEDSNTTEIINGADLSAANNSGNDNGAVYVFTRYGTTWSHQAYLKAPNNSEYDWFGNSVAIDGDTIAVGAYGEDSDTREIINGSDLSATNDDGSYNGAVYVFTRYGTTWSHQAYLKSPNNNSDDHFGDSVAISGDTIVVGAHYEDSTTTEIINGSVTLGANNSGNNNGAVYVFTRSGSTWSHQAYLKAPNSSTGDYFGYSVAIDGDTIAVGACLENSDATEIINGADLSASNDDGDDNGAVYVFTRSGTTWSHQAYLKAPNNSDGDRFGWSVDLSGDTIAVGANCENSNTTEIINDDDLSATNDDGYHNGAAYVFTRSGTTWSHQGYLKAPNNSDMDYFGGSVAIDGDTIVVGAYREGSDTTEVIYGSDLSATNDDGSVNGAAYVFTRSGTTWSHRAYLKAPNNSEGDSFGDFVAISGDTIAVGAQLEDSNTTEIINGADLSATNNSGNNSGAAYVFTLEEEE